jgi:hypothetical protein
VSDISSLPWLVLQMSAADSKAGRALIWMWLALVASCRACSDGPPFTGAAVLDAGLCANGVAEAAVEEDDRPAQSFEGPEKLLEIWWNAPPARPPSLTRQPSVVDAENPKIKRFGLRLISRAKLEQMLESVAVRIINVVSNEYVDAYLLRCVCLCVCISLRHFCCLRSL